MSNYTRELRYIWESENKYTRPVEQLSLHKILENYPIYKEELREELNNRIIERFYFREICCVPEQRFLFLFKRKLHEIMPLYNEKMETKDIEFNPLYNIELHETYSHTSSGEGSTVATNTGTASNTGNTTNSSDGIVFDNDTPNQEISEADVKTNKWASHTNHSKDNSNINSTSSNNQSSNSNVNSEDTRTESYSKDTVGSSAGLSFSHAIKQWREIIININLEILDELEECFMYVLKF